MNIVFIASVQTAFSVAPLLHHLLTEANEGSLEDADIEITGAMTTSAEQGWHAMRAMCSYMDIDTVLCFGKASASVGLPDLAYFTPVLVRLPSRLGLSHCMRIPSPAHPFWTDLPSNPSAAAVSLRPLLTAPPLTAPSPHIAWDSTAWN